MALFFRSFVRLAAARVCFDVAFAGFCYAPFGSVQDALRIQLLARAARSAPSSRAALDPAAPLSILSLSAASYGARPSEDMTIPTGFDPAAVVLFEAIIEGAYLVANADGRFDDDERRMFERIVVEACGGSVSTHQITTLVADLEGQLGADGIDRRLEVIASSLTKKEHAQEVLRVAALMAQVTDGASDEEREVLAKLARHCGLDLVAVDHALAGARRVVETTSGGS